MYATIDKTGKFTGTVYAEITKNVEQWHEENGFTYLEISDKLTNIGTDENPDYGFPNPTTEQTITGFERKLDQHIDSVAQAKQYDNRITASLRAAALTSPWHAEGVAFIEWMDLCYAKSNEILNAVQARTREIPTWEEVKAELPEMIWPQ